MVEITRTNTSRILTFLQSFRLDFNDRTLWNYLRIKFHEIYLTRIEVDDTIDYLEETGYIEKARREGYYKLTEKGQNFESWEIEDAKKATETKKKAVKESWWSSLFSSNTKGEVA